MTSEKTFSKELSLETLPIPDQNDALEFYDESMQASLTPEDYNEFKKVLEKFKSSGEAKRLHEKLIEKFITNNYSNSPLDKNGQPMNWLERLWQEKAYTDYRGPLYHLNIAGTNNIPKACKEKLMKEHPEGKLTGDAMMRNDISWDDGDFDLDEISAFIWAIGNFWTKVRKENYPPQSFRGADWTMDMFWKFFNSAHKVGEHHDDLEFNFSTEDKKEVFEKLNHFIFQINGRHVYSIKFTDEEGNNYSRAEIKKVIEPLVEKVSSLDKGASACEPNNDPTIFACDILNDRSQAFKISQKFSDETKNNLDKINKAAFVISMDFERVSGWDNAANVTLKGNPNNRIHHKPYTLIFFKGGYSGTYNCHSMAEGSAHMFCGREIYPWALNVPRCDTVESKALGQPKFEKLNLVVPEESKETLQKGVDFYNMAFRNNLIGKTLILNIGKQQLRPFKIHPNANIMIAIQLAYYKLHKQMPSTYETAQLRQFYHGRTETCRSFTNATKNFVLKMCEEGATQKEKAGAFLEAHENYLMNGLAAMNFMAFDRYLMALSSLDEECSLRGFLGTALYLSKKMKELEWTLKIPFFSPSQALHL